MFLSQDKKNIYAFMKNIREKNIDIQQFLKQYFYFITTYDNKTIVHQFLNISECLNHTQFHDEDTIITYFIEELLAFYKKLK